MSRLKVMIGRGGHTRVQETDGDSVQIYSAEDWKKKREGKPLEKKSKDEATSKEPQEEAPEKPKKKGKNK